MEWLSPWGIGAPGWHLECSVMSMKYLAEPFGQSQFDIHTGGIDHREIHHPNEIAQNQAYAGTADTGARFWMHNNFLVERGAKMSKSSGGFATLDTLIDAGVHPLAYRMLCLSAHYRSELEFSAENVLAALTRLKRLVGAVEKLRSAAGEPPWMKVLDSAVQGEHGSYDDVRLALGSFPSITGDWLALFGQAVANDLGTPSALTFLEGAATDRNVDPDMQLRAIAFMDLALGFGLLTLSRADLRIRPTAASLSENDVAALLDERQTARAAKDFAAGDAIRERLVTAGVEIMDGDPLGWDWVPQLA